METLVFGPVPSRRLGRSLGVNNIPPKVCTYSCVYCQAGRTTNLGIERQPFYEPDAIARAVEGRIELARRRGEKIDYVTFVSDGEPTLDIGLGPAIELVKAFGVPVAVVTNASLLWRDDVREALAGADWVSMKVDAVSDAVWRRIDRPHGRLSMEQVLEGQREFARSYKGTVATETLIVAGLNDEEEEVEAIAAHVGELRPSTAWLSIPMRPPAETWVKAPGRAVLERVRETFERKVASVGCLFTPEPDEFSGAGEAGSALLAIAAVHPVRESAALKLLNEAGADSSLLDLLVRSGRLSLIVHEGERFYRTAAPGSS